MARSTQKQLNNLYDIVKSEYKLKSRRESYSLLCKVSDRYRKHGLNFSWYKDGIFTVTKDNINYQMIGISDLDTPCTTKKELKKKGLI